MCVRRVRVTVPKCVPWLASLALLSGCGSNSENFVARKEPWRSNEERACLTAGAVRPNSFVRARSSLGGPSVCGTEYPFEMSAAMGGRVAMSPAALLRCPMIPQVDQWVAEVVDPAARMHFGQPIAELKVAASYSCRPINHKAGGRLSEHGYANALDVSGFTLADGTKITVKGGWQGSDSERGFLRTVHNGACRNFTTVLGPNADSYHQDHFHLDLARHGRDGLMRICR
ncbi:MAG: extensin family protein [Hyphomicrobium sp.]